VIVPTHAFILEITIVAPAYSMQYTV
jgi:hypothetical protein